MLRLTNTILLPFYVLASLFFLVQQTSHEWHSDALTSVLLKIAPIWYLFAYTRFAKPTTTAAAAKSNGKRKESAGELSSIEKSYTTFVSLGLAVSSVGDILMSLKSALIPGGLVFGVAHVLYVFAFRTRGTRATYAWLILPLAFVSLYTIASNVLYSNILVAFVFLYNIMISATVISALCCHENNKKWSTSFAALGASLFGISDYLIAFDLFVAPVPYSRIVIMVTYYSAQLLLAVSIER